MNELSGQGISWFLWACLLFSAPLLYCFWFFRSRLKKRGNNRPWNDYFVDPPEYSEPQPDESEECVTQKEPDLFKKYLHGFWHKKSSELLKFNDSGLEAQSRAFQEIISQQERKAENTKNFFLWDDGLIFCGFRLQGTDLRTGNLYGAYLRDMLLRDRKFGGAGIPLVLRDAENYASMDMSNTFLKGNIQHGIFAGADLARVDLSGLYLRDVGLQGVDIEKIMQPEDNGFGDYFLPESYQKHNDH